MNPNEFTHVGHVDPPSDTKGLIFGIGPRSFPLGIYMPKGYDIESRQGDPDDWTVLRVRDSQTSQVLTMWAIQTEWNEIDLAYILLNDWRQEIDPLSLAGAGESVIDVDLME
jgi:hypothetical protein